MSYAQDVFARFGKELELYESLLSETSGANEDASPHESDDEDNSPASESSVNPIHRDPVRDVFTAIRPSDASTTLPSVEKLLSLLNNLEQDKYASLRSGDHTEEVKIVALSRLVCSTYAVAIDSLLHDASKLDEESWYWTEINESMRKTMLYLIQTLPSRIAKATRGTLELAAGSASHTLRNTLDTSTASIVRSVDKAALRNTLRNVRDTPNLITSMLFPFTFHLERTVTLESATFMLRSSRLSTAALGKTRSHRSKRLGLRNLRSTILNLTPQYLVRHEAKCKRQGLYSERDELARKLGRLALQQEALVAHDHLDQDETNDPKKAVLVQLDTLLDTLLDCFGGDIDRDFGSMSTSSLEKTSGRLRLLLTVKLQGQQDRLKVVLSPQVFGQPSGLTQRWPTLVFYPVGLLLAARYLSKNWTGIEAKIVEAKETVRSFLIGWVWEPCVQLLDTVRQGNEGTVIMSRESLNSDLESLERMVSDFTSEKYGIKGDELQAISSRVREGDLTHVLKVYESEMRSPVKSMITGSLIRALLIQIQKAKVDLEVAMSGIDKLLKSQQLLFGAVGIAPALGILFVSQRYLRAKLSNVSSYRTKTMGHNYQIRAWEAMRRIDRLMTSSRSMNSRDEAQDTRDALTQGLLLLDLSTLRSVSGPLLMSLGKGNKATSKRLQRHFLQDIRDIESGHKSAVERMWRSWGSALQPSP